MSREFLSEILEKFAQVTSIIVETSKIKEDLDNSSVDGNLSNILERTKGQIENLFEHATSIKKLFKKHKENSGQNVVNGKNNADSPERDALNSDSNMSNAKLESEQGNSETSETHKPVIKLVDIKKLVEPRTLITENKRCESRHIQIAETVVLITSSDEEVPQLKPTRHSRNTIILKNSSPKKSTNVRTMIRRKAAEKTIEKTRKTLQSDSSSDDEVISPKSSRTSRLKNGTRRKFKEVERITLADASDTSYSSKSSSGRSSHRRKENNKTEQVEDLSWKDDPKLNNKCFVKVVRVPCEKLKEYYLEKLELLEINKLLDLRSLKRKRRKSGSKSCSDSESNESSRQKRRQDSKGQKENLEDSDITEDLDEPDAKRTPSPAIPSNVDNALSNAKAIEAMAEDALKLLESDKDENDVDSSDKESDKEGNDKQLEKKENAAKPSKEEENLDKNNKENDKNEDDTNKDGDKENSEKEPQEEPIALDNTKKKNAEEELNKNTEPEKAVNENKEISDTENKEDTPEKTSEKESDTENNTDKDNKSKNKGKGKWKNDKLLKYKLSSSDSEEELAKFQKKKEAMKEQHSSDDEPKQPKDKKKRSGKKRMKKAILSDSDSDNNKKDSGDEFKPKSSSSSSESEKEEEVEEEKPKARKRVKRVRDSSEDDEEKSTRKQIRHIIDRDSLADTTKKAEAEEKQRKARIAEKQRKYNQTYESDCLQNSKVEKVVLDFDEKNDKELLKVDDDLVSKLKPHQASGVQFMWDACFESLERARTTKGSGCIIAHCMGLGKTLQVITLSHTLLTNFEKTRVKKVLVVSPLNTVLNWVNEFKQWLPDNDDFEVFELVSFKQNFERQYQVKLWHDNGGVLIIGYDMFRNLSNPDSKRLSRKMRTVFQEGLVNPGADLVICDEGHLLKNEKTNLSIAMNRIKTLRRIVLTGTPLQNNMKEYFCMVQFIKPNLLGTYKEYLNRFVNPITNGQYTDSTQHDIQIMRKRSHVLHKMLDGVVQRRDYSVLEPYLPPKLEYVLFLKLSEVQIKLYQHYMDHFARRSTDGSNKTSFLFVDFQALQRICAHPKVLLDKSIQTRLAKEKMDDSEETDGSEGSLKDFIHDDEDESTSSTGSSSEDDGEKKCSAPRKRLTRAQAALAKENGEEEEEIIPLDSDGPAKREWWQEYCDGKELDVISHSSKLFLLFEILKECEQIGDKILIFSQSLYSLNAIEYFLGKIHDATQEGNTEAIGGYSGSWCLGLDYFRLDGSSSCDNRNFWCKTFNDPANTRARLFLISTKAGGLGINLVAANRVVIFDVSWNPSHDVQSIYRVYRFGQTKPSYIYRFVTLGTMEMKIYERQVTKQAISKRVIDEQQIDRHYNQNDLAELYKFDPDPGDRPTPLVPKDVLLGELIQKFDDRVYKYHEHQSLLENKEEEGLNEEERKAAWEEFENEKKQRNTWGSNMVRINNMELALASLLRKENPTMTDIQIRTMLPTLHAQMQEQVTKGDLTIYRRVQQEMQIIQTLQAQRLKDQFYQQQMLKAMQQQRQIAEAMKFHGVSAANWQNALLNQNQMPGTSRTPAASTSNPTDIIDLND